MKTSILLAVAISACCSQFASAAVQLSFAKQQKLGGVSTLSTGLLRRSSNSNNNTPNSTFTYRDLTYVVNVTVGTPGQPVALALSPSSSDTWVMDASSSWCRYTEDDYYSSYDYNSTDGDSMSSSGSESLYCTWGSFSSDNSSSFKLLNLDDDDDNEGSSDYYYDDENFSVSYTDGNYAYGSYMADVLTLGSGGDGATWTVPNLTMGLVNTSSTFAGVLGIGYNDSARDNLPDRLCAQGLINTTAYSIWVDDERAASGNLLFGAVDTARFEGNLTRTRTAYSYYKMTVQVAGINGSTGDDVVAITNSDADDGSSGSGSGSSGAYLFRATYSPPDSVSYLPGDVARQIWDLAGAYYDEDAGLAVISCTAANDSSTNVTIRLGDAGSGPVIAATMADLVVPVDEVEADDYSSSSYYYSSLDDGLCLFGVQNGTSSYYYSSSDYTLGSTLLRRTYSVFDLVNGEIAVAPVQFGAATATSNVVPFESYGAVVPSSTMMCESSYCYNQSSTGANDDAEDTGSRALSSKLLSVPALVGISLGIGIGCLVLGIAGLLLWRRRRDRQVDAKQAGSVASAAADETGQTGAVMSTAAAAPEGATGPSPSTHDGGVVETGPPLIPSPFPESSREGQAQNPPTASSEAVDSSRDTHRHEPSSTR